MEANLGEIVQEGLAEEYTTKDIAEIVLHSESSINGIAFSLGLGNLREIKYPNNRRTKKYFFTSEEKDKILEELKFDLNNVLCVTKKDEQTIFVTKPSRENPEEIKIERYVTLQYAERVSGERVATWWKRIEDNRCRGVYFGRNYVSWEDVQRHINSPKGITIKEAAEKVGISRKTVFNYRNKGLFVQKRNASNKPVISPEDLIRITRGLNCEDYYLRVKEALVSSIPNPEIETFCEDLEKAYHLGYSAIKSSRYNHLVRAARVFGEGLGNFVTYAQNWTVLQERQKRKFIEFVQLAGNFQKKNKN